jgi:hypothetical protein
MQSVPITTDVVSSNLDQGEVYNKYYVIKFVSDLQQVGGFLWVLRFPPPIKLTATIIGTDCIVSCKSNYHTITTTMAPGVAMKYFSVIVIANKT